MANIKINYILDKNNKMVGIKDKNIDILTIHKYIKCIGNHVFVDCFNLKKLYIPDNILEIDKWAFFGSSLKEISFPKHFKDLTDKFYFSNDNIIKKVRENISINTNKVKIIKSEFKFKNIIKNNLQDFKEDKEDLTFLEFLYYLKKYNIISSIWRYSTIENEKIFYKILNKL